MDPAGNQEPPQDERADTIRTNEVEIRLREAELANAGLDADDKRRYVVMVTIIDKLFLS